MLSIHRITMKEGVCCQIRGVPYCDAPWYPLRLNRTTCAIRGTQPTLDGDAKPAIEGFPLEQASLPIAGNEALLSPSGTILDIGLTFLTELGPLEFAVDAERHPKGYATLQNRTQFHRDYGKPQPKTYVGSHKYHEGQAPTLAA
jgi:hypothetical protein